MYTYKEILISNTKFDLKCPYLMTPQFIVVHNTANDASAESEIKYMQNSNSSTSFHYAVDDKTVIKAIPENRNAWHAGDGANGKGNRYGLSVEICYSKSGGEKFIKAEENAAKFIATLLENYGWDISKVKKHQDFSGKYCPHRTLDMGWDRFLNMIKKYMKEDDEMTAEERAKINGLADVVSMLTEKVDKLAATYDSIDSVPEWARPTISKLIERGFLKGDENGKLDLDKNMLRTLVILDRAKIF